MGEGVGLRSENTYAGLGALAFGLALLATVAGSAAAEQPSGAKGKGDQAEGKSALAPSIAAAIKRDPTPDETSTLEEERKQDLEIVIRRTRDFSDVVDGMIKRVYEMRKEFIDQSYQSKIDAEEALLLERLRDAIEYFEAFLRKYPDDPPYTPDAMFRLAELYYDESYIRYVDGLSAYNLALERGTAGSMESPVKEFDRTIGLFRDLVRKYPDYRNIDGAYYLLGYCLNDTAREEEARLAWLNLVCANKYKYDPAALKPPAGAGAPEVERPSASLDTGTTAGGEVPPFVDPFEGCQPITDDSRFFFESWWLIGNYHFDYDTSRYGVETAMAAYKKLIEDPTHRFYDKGLYKLAWSYFKADMYPEAIDYFSQVVEFSDKQAKSKGSGMRPEAIQYLAVCFFSDDWNVDMTPDSVSGIERLQDPTLMPQDRPWTQEVYARLGDIYSENEKHEDAIAVWKLFLERWPLDVQAPFVQDKIARSYAEMRRFEEELVERSKLDDYGKGSAWWNANEDHPDAQNEVAGMARDALINAAVAHHQSAQALRKRGVTAQDPEILELALTEYNLAAEAYRKFIDLYPDNPDAYDLNFQMADALFWSGQYEKAKTEYVAVRDSNLDDRYRADAGHMVIICLEKIMEKEIAAGDLELREEPPELEGDPPAPTPLPLPELLTELMQERETFLKNSPENEQAATFEYQSAQNYFRYGHWDEARTRFTAVYDKYCKKDEVSLISWKTMLNMAAEQNNLDERERLALLEQERQCAVEGVKIEDEGIDLGSLLGDVAMQRAMSKFKECSENKDPDVCTAAGEQLVTAVAKAPKHQSADAALHNAALAYEHAQRFETAMQIYGRIVDEYPESQWVDKCLFKQAYAANNFFEYDRALENYRILADEKRFEDSDYREDAIYNSAFILTNLQDYQKAVPYWKRYASEVDDREKSIEASFNAADMYFRAQKWNLALKEYESFIKRYDRSKEAGPFVVKASYRSGICHAKMNKHSREVKSWKETVDLYARLVNEPGSMSAEYAAESHFLLIEEDMRKFESFSIKGSQKVIDTKLKEGAEKVKDFEDRYRGIQKYRRPEWSLAAEFRIGYAYEVYAKAILNIPPPPLDAKLQKQLKQLPPEDREMVMMEYEDRFRMAMEEKVLPMEARAQEEYKIAINLAREGNISNDWTLLALERMNAYDPEGYPRQHNGLIEMKRDTVAAPPFAAEVQ